MFERLIFNDLFNFLMIFLTGAFKGTSREHLYQELGLESLKDRIINCLSFTKL